ncbi:hypothetical protein PHMEG_00020370 [Phytophthora megakarya]|uniref:Uncharacterized protein n=1 Tax=Phytophthora megakarya TaxID=4795 RepID=A0A225VPJ4_9STRA|nr:hypothetical protein PHMEG_00020370 [Phytophthora megakarya]
MKAQRFGEYVQASWRKFGFFPHPAVLRGLSCLDFGMRGLSILHFSRVTEQEKRTLVRKSDMSNFSKKNTLPVAPDATIFSVIFGAVESSPLSLSTCRACNVERRSIFSQGATVYVADDDWQQASTIKSHFTASHESFVRVHQLILHQDIISAVRTAKPTLVRSDRPNYGLEANKGVSIPVEVRNACLNKVRRRYIFVSFPVKAAKGRMENLCHFKPATFHDIVREFVEKNYGGVSVDMK